ncbi:DUF5689 domain-containing protein [Pedobacter sp. Hv1]|uniref:DUF5689 domain-containing protein n=1 Tax=Pedobacter sp. Hv1 TaxID=1740090 RepID=UPI0006D8A863|nr:DUF5689 domain-containing protein [Pedobacter sp. Hv1]KQB98610.1 hypothetical protein AQF98_21455 [Pedobacter sp. Hv1]
MKKKLKYILILTAVVGIWMGCKRDSDFIVGKPSSYISNFDLKKLYKNIDLPLNAKQMGGATAVKGVVISDFRSGNSPAGLLIIQNSRMAGSGIDSLRGMALNIGPEAAKYIPGDSVHVTIEGAVLKRINGILQIAGISGASVNKMASGKTVKTQVVSIAQVLALPYTYENTLITIGNSLVVPEPITGETFAGDKEITDGGGSATIHTEAAASFAATALSISGNFTGIPFITGNGADKKLSVWMRSIDDFRFAVLPKLSPAIITGYFGDPNGTDGNYEYIQFLATKDIDFSKTSFSVITNNNAGATTFPTAGWVTGGVRSYKFNLTSGTVAKGEYFYVGGAGKRINGFPSGAPSTDISSSKWIASVDYTKITGADGIGAVTTNLLANSGNLAGIAIFEGANVGVNTLPLDVIFFGGTGGNFYSAGPPEMGYRVTNTESYSTNNPSTGAPQPLMGSGTNSFRLGFANAISFASLGGEYDATSGRWNVKRIVTSITVPQDAPVTLIEGGTKLVN